MVAEPFNKRPNANRTPLSMSPPSPPPPPPPPTSDLPSHHHERPSSIPQVPSARRKPSVCFDQEARGACSSTDNSDSETVARQNSSGTEIVTDTETVREVKVLLLGQSGSGKSTLQTNLHIHLSPLTFTASRAAYKPVIFLNIIAALHALFIELDYQLSSPSIANNKLIASFRELREDLQLDKLRVRLLPLMALESLLVAELVEGVASPSSAAASVVGRGNPNPFVRPGWQERIAPTWNLTSSSSSVVTRSSKQSNRSSGSDLALLCTKTLASAAPDIHKLWNHWITRFYVSKRVIPLDDSAPYFLDHIERIGEVGYCPTNDDILHARIQTLGLTEAVYTVPLPMPQTVGWKWKVYDVSGVRGQRRVWVPFFDDASVVIFLAPISAFDQYLPENPSINLLADSLYLWASICSNKLLQHARLVLFLNKIDLLKKKLEDGICVRKYITSFSNRPNDFLTAASYFRAQFEKVQQRKDVGRPSRRSIFVHFTSMLDTKAMVTHCVVSQVKEAISRKYASEVSMKLL